jgi:hypothetical protein
MAIRRRTASFLGLALATLMLVALPAASASASAELRLVNARGGSDPVSLQVAVAGTTVMTGAAAFGDSSDPITVATGDAVLSLTGGKGSASVDKPLAEGARYTVVALPKGSAGFDLKVLRDGTAAPKDAKVRVVHAAPELGKPDIRLGDRTIAQGVEFRSDTGYLKVDPGASKLAVTRPTGGAPVLQKRVPLAAGTATTVILAGSGGSEARLIAVNDATVTPAGAPHTGLGGLARHGAPWALALLAALLAGALGAAARLGYIRRP